MATVVSVKERSAVFVMVVEGSVAAASLSVRIGTLVSHQDRRSGSLADEVGTGVEFTVSTTTVGLNVTKASAGAMGAVVGVGVGSTFSTAIIGAGVTT